MMVRSRSDDIVCWFFLAETRMVHPLTENAYDVGAAVALHVIELTFPLLRYLRATSKRTSPHDSLVWCPHERARCASASRRPLIQESG